MPTRTDAACSMRVTQRITASRRRLKIFRFQLPRMVPTILLAIPLQACVTVDRNTAASLGTAGEQATEGLSTQASGAIQTLGDLNQWWGVHDTLVCVHVANAVARKACIDGASPSGPDPNVQKLADLLAKRKQAIDTMHQAYTAFVDLAHYNAGQEATAALKTSCTDINSFLSAVSAFPGIGAIAPISATIEKVTAGVLGFAADSRENKLILAANSDLQSADVALSKGLEAEQKLTGQILLQLQKEREVLYRAGFDAGLIDPTDLLTPVFAEAYPGIRLQRPPEANRDVVQAAAVSVFTLQNEKLNAAVATSYVSSIKTLQALATQHQKLADKHTLTLSDIQTEASNLKADVAQMTSTDAPTTSTKK